MLKRNILIINIIISFYITLFSITEIELKNSGQYLYGTGTHLKFDKADKYALSDLSSQISTRIESSFEDLLIEKNGIVNEISNKIINTYSESIITNAKRLIIELDDGTGYKIFRYIKKEEKEKIFSKRKQKIIEYTKNGLRNEKDNDIGNSLRSFYWALILLKSVPSKELLTFDPGGGEKILVTFLSNKIIKILNSIHFKIEDSTERTNNYSLNVKASYNNNKILSLSFNYFDGCEWIESNIKDGKGVIYIPKVYFDNTTNMRLSIDYEYKCFLNEAALDDEVKLVSEHIYVNFDNSKYLDKGTINSSTNNLIKASAISNIITENNSEMIKEILSSIESSNFQKVRKYFTDDGFKQFMKIMNYGKVELYSGDHRIEEIKCGNQIQIRSIPLIITLKDKNKKIIYDEIVLLVENNKIQWVNFTISESIITREKQRSLIAKDFEKRMLGINFMEYYKTIFSLKDIALIEEIFADSAIIFTGYVRKTTSIPNDLQDVITNQLNNKQVEFNKMNKSQYLGKLQNMVFKRNENVYIQFSNLEILKRSINRQIYGIQLNQNYYSTNYSDEGFLLLLVDFEDEENPKIFFRCWQPTKQEISGITPLKVGDFRF
ncbi:MAG: hypothetical protein P9L97_11110 [Candidatus Tenebribacter davisii]|jgi:hypothetical protein|nr:hypothetical protein [Candidatus Tenebribacter davisii]